MRVTSGRPLGRRRQRDLRRSPSRRQESARPDDPRLDRMGRPARHLRGAAAARDRGRRRRRRLPVLLHPDARRRLRAVPAAPPRVRQRGSMAAHAEDTARPLDRRPAPADPPACRRGGRCRQGPDRERRPDHGGPDREVAVGHERPLPDLALRGVRRAGRPARHGRRLRRHVVGRRAASDGDGHPHRPRRPAAPDRPHAAHPVPPARRAGRGARRRRRNRTGEDPQQPALGDDDAGTRRARRHRRPHAGRSDVGGLGADATRPDARPEPGPARRQRPICGRHVASPRCGPWRRRRAASRSAVGNGTPIRRARGSARSRACRSRRGSSPPRCPGRR